MLAHSLRLASVVVGKTRQQEHKATSHIASAVTKQREVNDALWSFSPWTSVWDLNPRDAATQAYCGSSYLG